MTASRISTRGMAAHERGQAPPEPAAGGLKNDRGLWLVLGLLVLYAAIHIAFRLLASSALGEDDPIESLRAQQLLALYEPRQPPLYAWALYAVQQVMGPTVSSFLAIKYAALIGTGCLLYAVARRALGPGVLALMAVESLALIYQLSWRFHEGYTHQVGAMLAVAATTWALVRVIETARLTDFVVFGLVAGVGTLTQPIFSVFLLASLLAVTFEVEIRQRMFGPRFFISAALIAAFAGFYLWHALRHAGLSGLVGDPWTHGWRESAAGLWNAVRAPLFYLSPLILFLPVLFPGFLRRAGRDLSTSLLIVPASATRASAHHDARAPGAIERIVLRTSVLGLLLSSLGALSFGLKGYASHVFMPLYIASVIWLMSAVRRSDPSDLSISRFGRLALAIAVFALVARLANMFVLDPVCKICRWGVPYEGLAAALREVDASGATIVTLDHELGGNLRVHFPQNPVVLVRGARAIPADARLDRGKLVLVWSNAAKGADATTAFSSIIAGVGVGARDPAAAKLVRVPWQHLWRPTGYRFSEWRVLVLDRP